MQRGEARLVVYAPIASTIASTKDSDHEQHVLVL